MSGRFKVTYAIQRPPYWEVTHTDGRWWSVAYRPDGNRARYFITNGKGRVLDQHGGTGQNILNAVHEYERNT